MQFFDFVFLARSWAADRDVLVSELSALAAHHTTTTSERPEDDEPLNFMIFPEGTLVSKDTYPISKKYADKMNLVSNLRQ
jgi:1-acyl-sn-glycerol-3-phosphate acyltransferase